MIGGLQLFGGNDVYSGASGRLNGFVSAGDGNDTVVGGIDNDFFFGGNHNDTLVGNRGNDMLFGEANNDVLIGGLGKDSLTGGTGRDFFDFNAIGESLRGVNRDVILDFNSAVDDRIDLSTIDAKTGVGGNQAFTFIGAQQFHGIKGELRCSGGVVQGLVCRRLAATRNAE